MIEHLRDDEQVTLPIATFDTPISDNLDTLQIKLEPNQEFNGYDHPWVGGAGVNKADWADNSTGIGTSITKTATGFDMSPMSSDQVPQVPMILFPWSGTDTAITVSFDAWASASNTRIRFDGQPDSVYTSATGFSDKLITLSTTRTRYSYSGSLLSGTTGFRWFRLNSDTGATTATIHVENIQIEFASSASPYSPYENICPIYPANGKNLLPMFPSTVLDGMTYATDEYGRVHITGIATQTRFYAIQFTLDKGNYVLSGAPAGGQLTIRNGQAGSTPPSEFSGTFDDYGAGAKFSVSATATAWLNIRSAAGTYDTIYKPMIRPAEIENDEYIPYKGFVVTRTGKNLLDVEGRTVDAVMYSPITIRTEACTITKNGNVLSCATTGVWSKARFGLSPQFFVQGETYTISAHYENPNANTVGIALLDKSNTWHTQPSAMSTATSVDIKYTTTIDTEYTQIGFIVNNTASNPNSTVVISNIQVELGSAVTSYEPYQGKHYYSISDNPVYGGILDVTTGVLTVDMKCNQMTYAYLSGLSSDYIQYQTNVSQVGGNAVWIRNWNYTDYPSIITGGISATCNSFPISMHNKSINSTQYRTYLGVGSMTSVADFLSAVQSLENNGGGLYIAHELATPQTYQLTPQQIKTLIGTNNIWSDSGGILHVGYRAMTEPSDLDYGTEVLTPTEDKPYLWNYERIAFTDGTHDDQEKHILAVYGSTGKGIQKVEKEYYLSTSDTSVIGGSWGTTIPSIDVSKYLWTRDKITYTTGDLGYTNAECITKYTSDIVAPDISNAITTANDYSAGLVTTERDARLEAIETITTNYENLVSTVSSNSTSIATNAQNIELRATKTEVTQLSNALAEVQQFRTTTTNYLTFDATRGLVMSATINGVKSPVESVINNSAWQLVTSGKVVQQVDANEGAQFSAIVLKALSANDIPTLTLGHLVISVQTNGTVIGKKA